MAPSKSRTGERMTPASTAGQMPPTDENPTRQRYQMGCSGSMGGGDIAPAPARQRTRSSQFNRGSSRNRGGY